MEGFVLHGFWHYSILAQAGWIIVAWAAGCLVLAILIIMFFTFQNQEKKHRLDFLKSQQYEFGVLFCQSGPLEGEKFPVARSGLTIGREPATCDVVIPSNSVSREHSRIFLMRDRPVIADLNSKNGTCVNGDYITQHELQNGDVIELGRKRPITFVFKVM